MRPASAQRAVRPRGRVSTMASSPRRLRRCGESGAQRPRRRQLGDAARRPGRPRRGRGRRRTTPPPRSSSSTTRSCTAEFWRRSSAHRWNPNRSTAHPHRHHAGVGQRSGAVAAQRRVDHVEVVRQLLRRRRTAASTACGGGPGTVPSTSAAQWRPAGRACRAGPAGRARRHGTASRRPTRRPARAAPAIGVTSRDDIDSSTDRRSSAARWWVSARAACRSTASRSDLGRDERVAVAVATDPRPHARRPGRTDPGRGAQRAIDVAPHVGLQAPEHVEQAELVVAQRLGDLVAHPQLRQTQHRRLPQRQHLRGGASIVLGDRIWPAPAERPASVAGRASSCGAPRWGAR